MNRKPEDLRKNKIRIFFSCVVQIVLISILISCSKNDKEELSSLNSINNLIVNNHMEVYTEINVEKKTVDMLIPFNSTLSLEKVKLILQISKNAISNIDAEKEYDLTNPMAIEITAEDKSVATYTLNAKKCEGGKSAIIVSDTQNDIIPLYRQSEFFENANIVLDKAYKANVPIYYIMLKSLKGTSKWDLPSELHYYGNGKIVDKDDVYDAFDGTILHKEFLNNGISKVYVIGVSSMGCVIGTCRGANKRKYEVTLISNAHSEPIGYREESAIDDCNQIFLDENLGQLIQSSEIVL